VAPALGGHPAACAVGSGRACLRHTRPQLVGLARHRRTLLPRHQRALRADRDRWNRPGHSRLLPLGRAGCPARPRHRRDRAGRRGGEPARARPGDRRGPGHHRGALHHHPRRRRLGLSAAGCRIRAALRVHRHPPGALLRPCPQQLLGSGHDGHGGARVRHVGLCPGRAVPGPPSAWDPRWTSFRAGTRIHVHWSVAAPEKFGGEKRYAAGRLGGEHAAYRVVMATTTEGGPTCRSRSRA